MPDATDIQPRWTALEDEAQAFSMLKIGMSAMPRLRSATCPAIISWWVVEAPMALATKAFWILEGSRPASPNAVRTATSTSCLYVSPGCLPKRVMPTPTM